MKVFVRRVYTFLSEYDPWILWVLIGGYLILGAIYTTRLGGELHFLPDEQDYRALAENLVVLGRYSLDGEQPSAYRPPGYPAYLALFRLAGAELPLYRMANFIAIGAAMYALYWILRARGVGLAAVLGLGMVWAYPVLFYTAGTLYPQSLAAACLVWILWLVTAAKKHWDQDLLTGLLCGFLILVVPTFILSLGILLVWIGLKFGLRRALLVGLVSGILLAGWTLRNWIVFDRLVFVSTNSGENLLLGNSETTTPNGGRTVDISRYEAAAAGLSEVDRDQYFRQEAIAYIWQHPARSVEVYLLKVINHFNYRNDLVTASQESRLQDLVMLLTYGPLLGIFVIRLLLWRQYPPDSFDRLNVTLYLTSALVMAVFFTRIRFRLPFDLLLILIDARFIDQWLRQSLGSLRYTQNETKIL